MAKTRESVSVAMRFYILRRDKFTCQYCGAKAPDTPLHIEHIVPVVEGGSNDPDNLCAACIRCNLGKGTGPKETTEQRPPTRRERELGAYREFWISSIRYQRWAAEAYVGGSPGLRLLLFYFAHWADPHGSVFEVDIGHLLHCTGLSKSDVLSFIHGLTATGYISRTRFDDLHLAYFDLMPVDQGSPPAEHIKPPPLAWFGDKLFGFSSAAEVYG